MKIKLIAIGKTQGAWLIDGIAEYKSRLKHYTSYECIEIPDIKNRANIPIDKLKELEELEIEKYLDKDSFIIALDENGKEYSSENFSNYILKKISFETKSIIFVIGGAFGISNVILERCNDKIALSKMTFSHQMVRLVFTEQLYRAFTIIKNEKYHHK